VRKSQPHGCNAPLQDTTRGVYKRHD
jgi:hypothetical protein